MPYLPSDSEFPFVRMTFKGHISAEDIAEYEAHLSSLLTRGARFGTVLDMVEWSDIDRQAAMANAGFYKRYHDACAKYYVGAGLVLTSAALRFIFSSILLVAPLPMPYQVVRSVEDGERYVAKRFTEESVPLPPGHRLLSI